MYLQIQIQRHLLFLICSLVLLSKSVVVLAQILETSTQSFGIFNQSHYQVFTVEPPSSITNGALQITPDSINNDLIRQNKSGRITFKQPYKLWDGKINTTSERIASFNTSFLVNIYRPPNNSAGEGFAFVIAPDQSHPKGSEGQYLGLTNATNDGNWTNHFIAIELDTVKQDYDPDANHIGLNLNSVRSSKTVSLTDRGIEIAPADAGKNYTVWIDYDGRKKVIKVYMEQQGRPRPSKPLINERLNLRDYVLQESYFAFSASTGNWAELNCVLEWRLTVEMLPRDKEVPWVKIGVGLGVGLLALLVISAAGVFWYVHMKSKGVDDERILGALKSLPGMPREFRYKDLKKATNNFDEKLKLGQGGFGVVYKGLLSTENIEVAVKKFSRDNLKGKDDFLSELTIINRLRHKHLVRLHGWCHQNGMLLLVYEYMPNGSLDSHLFDDPKGETLSWDRRYKIISGVASALHYLHNEYDQKVVHRDLKASNVLLDSHFNARLGDFGLARAIDNEKTSYVEDLDGLAGTLGYIAPECFHTGKATRESDVFAFGAVVLEVVCGQRPCSKIQAGTRYLVDYVWALYREGRILEAVDQKLEDSYNVAEAERLLLLGLACSHPIANQRPKTQGIVQITSGSVPAPSVPHFRPSFVWPMNGEADITSSTMDSTMNTGTSYELTPMSSSYYDYGASAPGSARTPQSATAEYQWLKSSEFK